jgi:hypothetical protein
LSSFGMISGSSISPAMICCLWPVDGFYGI